MYDIDTHNTIAEIAASTVSGISAQMVHTCSRAGYIHSGMRMFKPAIPISVILPLKTIGVARTLKYIQCMIDKGGGATEKSDYYHYLRPFLKLGLTGSEFVPL